MRLSKSKVSNLATFKPDLMMNLKRSEKCSTKEKMKLDDNTFIYFLKCVLNVV